MNIYIYKYIYIYIYFLLSIKIFVCYKLRRLPIRARPDTNCICLLHLWCTFGVFGSRGRAQIISWMCVEENQICLAWFRSRLSHHWRTMGIPKMWSVTSERLCNARGAQHQPELLSSGAFNRQITLFIYLFTDLYI